MGIRSGASIKIIRKTMVETSPTSSVPELSVKTPSGPLVFPRAVLNNPYGSTGMLRELRKEFLDGEGTPLLKNLGKRLDRSDCTFGAESVGETILTTEEFQKLFAAIQSMWAKYVPSRKIRVTGSRNAGQMNFQFGPRHRIWISAVGAIEDSPAFIQFALSSAGHDDAYVAKMDLGPDQPASVILNKGRYLTVTQEELSKLLFWSALENNGFLEELLKNADGS